MAQLVFYNTEKRAKEPFIPQKDNQVTMYTCGPTVYNYAHIGNLRTYMFEDILRRTLKYFGYQLKHVMNITDVDDKTIKRAVEQKITLDEFTAPFKEAFFEDLKKLNIEPAEYYPCATDYISQMIKIIETLLKKEVAYKGSDGSIYFAIDKFPRYGCLSHLKLDELEAGASDRVNQDEYDKEHASDFVLWKGHDPERDGPIYWDSPFGPGRPGWHLECSTMAMELLGESIDIHCGGVDNMFPHHENEIAQSEASTGKQFVKYWLHSEHLIVDGKKMSKSLGNFHTLRDLLEKGYEGSQIRYLLLQTHYKTQLNFTFDGLVAAKESLHRINDFIYRIQEIEKGSSEKASNLIQPLLDKAEKRFSNAMADDLNISEALASIYDVIREVNALCDANNVAPSEAETILTIFKKFDSILGVMNFNQKEEVVPNEILEALEKRIAARQEKNWSEADRLRDFILSQGFIIEDSPAGPRVKKG